jgi:four helix bundle protein
VKGEGWTVERKMPVKDFRELDVYKIAFQSAMEIFDISKKWPPDERYSLTSQIRKSSRSICSNIGEAWRKRRYVAAFVSKLSDADAESGETMVWIDFAKACGYLNDVQSTSLEKKYNQICAQLVTMITQADKWCT